MFKGLLGGLLTYNRIGRAKQALAAAHRAHSQALAKWQAGNCTCPTMAQQVAYWAQQKQAAANELGQAKLFYLTE